MADDRSFLTTPAGKILAGVAVLGLVCYAAYSIFTYFKGDELGDPNSSTFVCLETGKSFKHHNEVGETMPILSPFSGKNTGYPAEPCYWNADGTLRKDPSWVLLNETIGKTGPTFCPDCGRLVRPRMPIPKPGDRPPPTQAEMLHDAS